VDRPARLLLVTTTPLPAPRGRSARWLALLPGLAAVARVDVLAPRTGDQPHLETFAGARVLRVPVEREGRSELLVLRAAERQLAGEEYDLVQVDDARLGAALLPTRCGALVIEAHEPGSLADDDGPPRIPEIEAACLREAHAVLVPSALARSVAVTAGAQEGRVFLVPPAVDLGAFVPAPPLPGPLRLLYAGGHEPWRGLPALIFAVRLAAARVPLLLRIVGNADPGLANLVRTLGLDAMVKIEPPIPHESMPAALAAAHAVVFPLARCERNERSGAAPQLVAEALAAGRPVIAGDVPALRAMMHDRMHGLFVPPGSEVDLARAIVELAADPQLRARVGEAARRQAEARFAAQDALRALLSVYRIVLRGAQKPQLRPLAPVDHERGTEPGLRLVRG
jgi:glycosyltransferase involved in cell wall biosynthesis